MSAIAQPAVRARAMRLGFVGVGWIGRHRMKAMLGTGRAEASMILDPGKEAADAAREACPGAAIATSFEEVLECDLDGIVVATPSALHAEQSIRALERGVAVFCQKPLGRNIAETRAVVEAARRAGRLLGVDLSYRYTQAAQRIRELVRRGELGQVYAASLVFHNAYGPGKPWFRDRRLSGGGCVVDLGIHLVDLALWSLGFPAVTRVAGSLHSRGERLRADTVEVEDYAVALLETDDGCTIQIACSWNLPAGQDAVIAASFYGTGGGAEFANIGGSFYDFAARRLNGTEAIPLVEPPDDWGGRAAVAWLERLAAGGGYDPECEQLVAVSGALDAIYAAGGIAATP